VRITAIPDPAEAEARCRQARFDCVVLDAGLGTEARERLRRPDGALPPRVWYAPDGEAGEPAPGRSGDGWFPVGSPAELVDRVALLLHQSIAGLTLPKRRMLEAFADASPILAGRKALVVDDDIRNIFATTSVLEKQGMVVLSAENGHTAIEVLQATPDVDVVLMDIMMPGMDGYDTMRAIRRMPAFRGLPIVAVTAKAMKGDREKTIEAGAWDYLAKPVEPDRMLSVLRAWLI
jgi:CheY-like chemotaxis protein